MYSKEIFIRCDSSLEIGSGHLYRTLALGEQLKAKGYKIRYFCQDLPGSLHRLVIEQGHSLTLMPANLNSEQDAEFCLNFFNTYSPTLVVVDHYNLDKAWERVFYDKTQVLVIDDLANRQHFCHMLIDYNYSPSQQEKYKSLVPPMTNLYLGPEGVIFRDEFLHLTELPTASREGVVVFFGGHDSSGESKKFLKSLCRQKSKIKFKLIVTNSNINIEQIKNWPQQPNLEILIQPPLISEIFLTSELYFGSGGTVTWERMRSGLPGLVVAVADNQLLPAQNLAKGGYQIFISSINNIDYGKAILKCEELLNSPEVLAQLASRSRKLVKPFLISNLTEKMNSLRIRRVVQGDAQFLFELRRDPKVNRASIQQDDFSFTSHVEWLNSQMNNSEVSLFALINHNELIGQIRIDADLTVSISIASSSQGKGHSTRALKLALGTDSLCRDKKGPILYRANISPDNTASIKSFISAGFIQSGKTMISDREFMCFEKLKNT